MEEGLVICKGHSPQDAESWDACTGIPAGRATGLQTRSHACQGCRSPVSLTSLRMHSSCSLAHCSCSVRAALPTIRWICVVLRQPGWMSRDIPPAHCSVGNLPLSARASAWVYLDEGSVVFAKTPSRGATRHTPQSISYLSH